MNFTKFKLFSNWTPIWHRSSLIQNFVFSTAIWKVFSVIEEISALMFSYLQNVMF